MVSETSNERGAAETMTLAEWARTMGMSLANTYQLAQLGRIPGLLRVGRRQWRVSRRVVERQLEGQALSPPSETVRATAHSTPA